MGSKFIKLIIIIIYFTFQAFVGQKYGERPVPQLILSEIYELLETVLAGNTGRRSRHKKLLEKWYKPDENSIPMVHVLRSPEVIS